MEDVADIKRRVRVAFPASPFYGTLTDGCNCGECSKLSDLLYAKCWDAVDDDVMDFHFGSLPLLSSEAFPAFLPAWLMRSLDSVGTPEHKIREWTLYSIALYHNEEYDDPAELLRRRERLRSRYERLTPDQSSAVEAFLRLIRDHARTNSWDRESIDRALDLLCKP